MKLNLNDQVAIYAEAVHRMQIARSRNATNSRGLIAGFNKDFEMNVDGVAAEVVVAKALGVEYTGGVPYKADDVAGCEVKQTGHKNGHLLIPPYDTTTRFKQIPNTTKMVLVIGTMKTGFRVAGWITAGEGRKIGKLGSWGNPRRPPIYGVSQKRLRPIGTLTVNNGG